MQTASTAYKEEMKREYREQAYIRVTIGLINQEAQASGVVSGDYTYYSSLKQPLDNYQVQELYATCDQNYSLVDGSMYFLPRRRVDVVLNQGIVTEDLLGPIEIRFPFPHDIKGLTMEFGEAYPVEFSIVSDSGTISISGNSSGHFVTEEIFESVTFLRFVPAVMVNGQSRLRIHQITMGIGIYFDNRSIISATKREHVSPIMEELHTLDFELVVDNKDRTFDIENEESTVNFLEIGQEIKVLYGQELEGGIIEWMPGAVVRLREWSADDEEMYFSASDRFEDLDAIYYKGLYRPGGISLYDLAVDVMEDAGVDSRTYWLDGYLKSVIVQNPMPAVAHKEALQIIANAGRCLLGQDRNGNLYMKSSFIPDMVASSDNETYFSNAASVLGNSRTERDIYALAGENASDVEPAAYFLPRELSESSYLDIGYVSEAVADGSGNFIKNPSVEIELEARYKCFEITLEFGRNHPEQMEFHAYLAEELQEIYQVSGLAAVTVISHEFPEFDRLVLEFTKGCPNNRIVLDWVRFGNSTDYEFGYGSELTRTPKGTQLTKVRELQILRTLYSQSNEKKELAREEISVTTADNRYTFYFNQPSYDLSCTLTAPQEGQGAVIVDSSNYFATVEITGVTGACEVSVTGREYVISQARISRSLNTSGSLEVWENPLVSSIEHGIDMADWVGDYLKADREYDLEYRGEPRIDVNDIAFLENKYVPDLLIRVCDHTLKFNGGLSGTIKARRVMEYVAGAQNRLD